MSSMDPAGELYLDLMKRCLTRLAFPEKIVPLDWGRTGRVHPVARLMRRVFLRAGFDLVRTAPVDSRAREEGRDWPADAETMVGLRRLDNLQACVTDVVARAVPGDLIETGVWRGGASIFMRAVLKVLGDTSRVVWLADSFKGLPRPDAARYPADANDPSWTFHELAIPMAEVQANFRRYGLLDDQVKFLPGWFRDTLPAAPIERLAVLRLDGDLYESTLDALTHLYPKLSAGGYAIIDDYALPACRAAVHDYRTSHGIGEPMVRVDDFAMFWQRLS